MKEAGHLERLWTKPFILLTAGMLFLSTGFYMLLPTVPLYVKQLGGNEAQVGLVVGIFTLAAVICRPIVGGLLDRYGRRPFLLIGLIFFVFSMYLYEWAGGIAALIALRILHGTSWAVSTTAVGTTVTDVIPASRRGEGMGWFGVSMTIAMAIGPMLGTWILSSRSFQQVFLVAAALSVVMLALAFATKVPFQPKAETRRMEFVEKPILPLMLIIFLLTVSYGAITTFLPLFADSISVNPGTYFLVYAVLITLIRPVAGKLSDRYGETAVIVPALLIMIAALIVVSLSKGLLGFIVSAALYGIGFGSAQPAFQSMALRLARPDRKGVVNASIFTAFDLGIGVGSIVLGGIASFTGYSGMFAVSAVSVTGGLIIFAIFARKKLKEASSAAQHTSG